MPDCLMLISEDRLEHPMTLSGSGLRNQYIHISVLEEIVASVLAYHARYCFIRGSCMDVQRDFIDY